MGTNIHCRTHQMQQLCVSSKFYDSSVKERISAPLSPESGDVVLGKQDLTKASLTKGIVENLEVRYNYK